MGDTIAYMTAGLPVPKDPTQDAITDTSAYMTAGLPRPTARFNGHRLYKGDGDLEDVDFSTVVQSVPAGVTEITEAAFGGAASHDYPLIVRPVYKGLETPDYSNRVTLQLDGDQEWRGLLPVAVQTVRVVGKAGAVLRVYWYYRTPPGELDPTDFGVYHNEDTAPTAGSPDATVNYSRGGEYSHEFSLANATVYHVGVTARNSGGDESDIATAGPITADSAGPTAPSSTVTGVYE